MSTLEKFKQIAERQRHKHEALDKREQRAVQRWMEANSIDGVRFLLEINGHLFPVIATDGAFESDYYELNFETVEKLTLPRTISMGGIRDEIMRYLTNLNRFAAPIFQILNDIDNRDITQFVYVRPSRKSHVARRDMSRYYEDVYGFK